MKRYHIHTDLQVTYRVTLDGRETDLSQLNLSIYLADRLGAKHEIQDFQAQGSTITFQYLASEQHSPGIYTLELWLNRGDTPQSVIDRRQAFSLVRYTEQEGGKDDDALTVTPLALLEEYHRSPEPANRRDTDYIMVGKRIPQGAHRGMKYYAQCELQIYLGYAKNDKADDNPDLQQAMQCLREIQSLFIPCVLIEGVIAFRKYMNNLKTYEDAEGVERKSAYYDFYISLHLSAPVVAEVMYDGCKSTEGLLLLEDICRLIDENDLNNYTLSILLRDHFHFYSMRSLPSPLRFRKKGVSLVQMSSTPNGLCRRSLAVQPPRWRNAPDVVNFQMLEEHDYNYQRSVFWCVFRYSTSYRRICHVNLSRAYTKQNMPRVIYLAPRNRKRRLVKYVADEESYREYKEYRGDREILLYDIFWHKAPEEEQP